MALGVALPQRHQNTGNGAVVEARRKQKDPEKHTARGLIAGGPVLIITELRSNELIITMGGETFPGLSASSGLPCAFVQIMSGEGGFVTD